MSTLKRKGIGKCIEVICYIAIFFVFAAPILRLFMMSLNCGEVRGFGNYALLLKETRTRQAILNTIIIAVGSTLISTVLGTFFAFVIAYTNLKHKRLLELLVLMPFIIPSYIITLSWSSLLSKRGMINSVLAKLGIGSINIYSVGGIILVLGICSVPVVYMNVIHMLRKIPVEIEQASRTCGYNTMQTLKNIYLVQAMPSIINSAILAFLAAIDNFAVPAFLGISSGIPVLSTYIYEKSISFGPDSFNLAAALSVMLSVIAVGGTLLEGVMIKKSSDIDSIKEDYSVRLYLYGKMRNILSWGVTAFLVIINIIPVISMFKSAFQKNYGVKFTISEFTLRNFQNVLKNKSVIKAVGNSVLLALICCVVCIIIGTVIAYYKVRKPGLIIWVAEKSASLTYAIPGIVLSLSMIFNWVEPVPGFRPGIYGTIYILILAYITRYLILQIKGSTTAMLSINPSLEEAAAACGRSRLSMWLRIMIPMLAKPVISSAFIIFVSALTELTLSSMLAAAGTRTIGLMIFNFQQAGDYNMAAAMSAIIVVLVLAGYIMVNLTNNEMKDKGE